MVIKRAIIISSFQHCGLYPMNNQLTDDDFKLSKNFECSEKQESANRDSCARNIIPSPLKEPNPTHKSPHQAHLISHEQIK